MQHNVDFTVRLRGESANILKELVDRGYCASKTEALRTALIRYGLEMGLIPHRQMLKRIQDQVSKKGYTEEEIKAQIATIKQ